MKCPSAWHAFKIFQEQEDKTSSFLGLAFRVVEEDDAGNQIKSYKQERHIGGILVRDIKLMPESRPLLSHRAHL